MWPLVYWKCYREDCSDPGNEKTSDPNCLKTPEFTIDGFEVDVDPCPDIEIEVTIPNIYYDFALHGRQINGQYVKTTKYRNGKVSYRKAAIFDADYQFQDGKFYISSCQDILRGLVAFTFPSGFRGENFATGIYSYSSIFSPST